MKEIVRALIIILIITLVWMGFSIYLLISNKQSSMPSISSQNLSNFNTSLYTNNLGQLISKEVYICIDQSFNPKPCLNANKL